MTIAELREAAENASRWAILGNNGPGGKKNNMKNSMIEKYGSFAIDLGINNEMDTELNMSPEGKLRRKALIDKDDAGDSAVTDIIDNTKILIRSKN